jgi:hypothetical protein
MRYPDNKRIWLILKDGSIDGLTKELVIDRIEVIDNIVYFNRGRRELLAAPMDSILYWH